MPAEPVGVGWLKFGLTDEVPGFAGTTVDEPIGAPEPTVPVDPGGRADPTPALPGLSVPELGELAGACAMAAPVRPSSNAPAMIVVGFLTSFSD